MQLQIFTIEMMVFISCTNEVAQISHQNVAPIYGTNTA